MNEQITNISHDLRTPLASILGYFELIESDEVTSDDKKNYLKIIKSRSIMLRNLLDNYYDLVQGESETNALVMQTVNLKKSLIEVASLFYLDFKEAGIELEIDDPLPEISVIADYTQLERVFGNLLRNVVKHGYSTCVIRHKQNKKTITTTIKNKTKPPVAIDIHQVFNRSYSADKTRMNGNTGIGLTITKVILEKMGHTISAEIFDDWFIITLEWKV